MAYEALIEQLSDPSPEVREMACWTLGQLRHRDAARSVIKLLKHDPADSVRWAAAASLAHLKDEHTVPALVNALLDPDLLVRRATVGSLGSLGQAKSVDSLKAALEQDNNELLRTEILAALRRITGVVHRYLTVEEKKIEKYRLEVERHPKNGHAHHNLAVAYFHHREFRLSRIHCELARELGTGVLWLQSRLDDLPPEAFVEPPPVVTAPTDDLGDDVASWVEGDRVAEFGPDRSEADDDPEGSTP